MKKFFISILGVVLLNGCASLSPEEIRTRSELKFKKILVMPFTRGGSANTSLAQDAFISELALLPGIEITGKGQMDETTIKNLRVNHPDSFGALDFSASPEGDDRRKKVLDRFNADAIIFGYSYIEQDLLSLVVQMMDATTGEVILSFSKDSSLSEGPADGTARDLARKSAQKTIDFLKDNIIITNIRRR